VSASEELFRSTDAGKSWARINDSRSLGISALAIDPQRPSTLIAGRSGSAGRSLERDEEPSIARSFDGGVTWASVPLPDTLAGASYWWVGDVIINPKSPQLLYATFNQQVASGTAASDQYANYVCKSIDGGETWRLVLPNGGAPLAIDPRQPNTLYVGDRLDTGSAILKSTDGGESWRAMNAGLPQTTAGETEAHNVATIAVDPGNSSLLYAGIWARRLQARPRGGRIESAGGLYRSSDGGESWQPAMDGLPPSNSPEYATSSGFPSVPIDQIAIDPNGLMPIFALTYGGFRTGTPGEQLYRSMDHGRNWAAVNGPRTPTSLAIGAGP
jgi:photosystem II stability/assembly factor-like uncharacterized protein